MKVEAHGGVLIVLTLITIGIATRAQTRDPAEQQRTIVTAWNECGESMKLENALLTDLQRSFKFNPPWRVVDLSEDHPKKRAQLIEEILYEHKRRIVLLEKIKEADKQ